ncbi:MAG TPA: hypothetical protein DCL60_08760, partial [Armatimonadetes bacterium]|nr:hypothetical protein [Armatimonadota bacterium]
TDNRELMTRVADELLERETLDRDEFAALIRGSKPEAPEKPDSGDTTVVDASHPEAPGSSKLEPGLA